MPIRTVRPSADWYVNDFLNQASSASNLFQSIDDDPADSATYIRAQAAYPAAEYRCQLGNLSPALSAPDSAGATQRIRYVQIFWTSWTVTAGQITNSFVTWRDGGDATAKVIPMAFTRDSSYTTTTTPGTLRKGHKRTTAGPRGEWTEALINRGQFEMFSKGNFASRIGDVWAEVYVDDRPTVTSPTVADAGSTTTPTVSWTYSDTQEDPQKGFQVKVYRAQETQKSGFSPDSTAFKPVWDSGQLRGNASELRTGVPLINAQSYVWYVRAAQDFNGKLWFSAWVSTSATIAATPPGAPTLTVTKDETVPSLRSLLTGTFVGGGGFTSGHLTFEYADLTDGPLNWATPQLATGTSELRTTAGFFKTAATDAVSSSVEKALAGEERSLRWDVVSTSGNLDIGASATAVTEPDDHFIPARPGVSVLASLYASADASFNSELIAQPIDILGNAVGGSFTSGNIVIGTGSLDSQRFQVAAFTQPAAGHGVRLRLTNRSSVTGRRVHVSGVKVREGSGTETEPATPGQGKTVAWKTVRGGDPTAAITGSSLYALDEEHAPGTLRLYRAYTLVNLEGASERASARTYSNVQYMTPPGSSQFVLKDPAGTLPSVRLFVAPDLSEEIVEQATDYDPLGREFGVTISDVIGGLDGVYTWRTDGEREWEKLLRYLKAQRTVLVQYPSGGQKYVRLRSRKITRYGAPPALVRRVEVDYKQRARPA